MRARIGHGGRVTRLLAASAVAGIATGAAFGLSTAEVPLEQASVRQAAAAPVVEHQPAARSIETSLVAERTGTVEPAEPSEPECGRRAQASTPPAYGWPVKPFHRQHPVRGYFGDPRVGPGTDGTIRRSLHFGVDVSAPDGTAVYATATGVVAGNALHSDVIEIVQGSGVELSYWHVTPAVRPGQRVVAYETLIGHIGEGWGHVHLSERRNGSYVNPLRPGAMGPYEDGTCPAVKQVRFERDGERMRARSVHGTVDVVVGALDPPAVSAPTPWRDLPVTPALVEWRIVSAAGRVVEPWRAAHDVRSTLPTGSFESTYAIRTRQNRPNRAGTYRFYLAQGWASGELRNGSYAVEVRVVDTYGNQARSSWPFVVAN
jgi:hypothetical protein